MGGTVTPGRVLFWCLVATALVLALLPYDMGLYHPLSKRSLDAAHFFAFGALAFAVYHGALGMFFRRRVVRVALFCAIVAVGVEALQGLGSRTATAADVALDMLGVAVFLAIPTLWTYQRLRWLWLLLLAGLSLVVLLSPATEAYRIWTAHHQLPLLGGFETSRDLLLWRPIVPAEQPSADIARDQAWVSQGNYALSLRTRSGNWSGVEFSAYGADWRPFHALRFDVYNPGQAFDLMLRLDDATIDNPGYTERFNDMRRIDHGWNHVVLTTAQLAAGPRDRRLDLSRIHRLLIFVASSEPSRQIYLDNVRLD